MAVISFGAIAYFDINAVWAILAGIAIGLIYTSVKKKDGGEVK